MNSNVLIRGRDLYWIARKPYPAEYFPCSNRPWSRYSLGCSCSEMTFIEFDIKVHKQWDYRLF